MGFIFGGAPKAPDTSKQEARIEEDRKIAKSEKTAIARTTASRSVRRRRGQRRNLFDQLAGVTGGLQKNLG